VNLEQPWRETAVGWDTRDHALDVVVDRDGSWAWKDEDHLAAEVTRGHVSHDEAERIRAEGERVIADRPWPTGWEAFEPDPSWPLPTLPAAWDVL